MRRERDASRCKTKPARLSFGSQDDALDFARHSAERGRGWLAAHSLDIPERYCNGNLSIVLRIAPYGERCECDLVIFSVPPGKEFCSSGETSCSEMDLAEHHGDWLKQHDMSAVADLVECPNGIVPSLIRIESPKQRQDLREEIVASTAAYHVGFKLGFRVGDREISSPGPYFPGADSGSVPGLIKSRSQGDASLESQFSGPIRESFGKSDLVDFVRSIRIKLANVAAWLVFKEPLDPRFQVTNMFVCTPDEALGTVEEIASGHDERVTEAKAQGQAGRRNRTSP